MAVGFFCSGQKNDYGHPAKGIIDFREALFLSPDKTAQSITDQDAAVQRIITAENDTVLIVIKMPGSSVSYILCHIHGRFEINGIIDDDRDLLVKIRIEFRKRRAGKICRFLGSVLFG